MHRPDECKRALCLLRGTVGGFFKTCAVTSEARASLSSVQGACDGAAEKAEAFVRVTVEQQLPGNLSIEDWTIMREIVAAVRQAIPDAAQRPAREVLQHVLVALRQAEAKTIEQTYAENPSADESKR